MSRSVFVALALAAAGCSAVESVAPAPQKGAEEPTTTSGGGGQGGGGGSAPAIRTVSERNPWGGPAGNLLADGDFEMAIALDGGESPTGWVALGAKGDQRYLRGETGGLCRSGLRCGVLEPGVLLFGRGAAAAGVGMAASLWAKPPSGQGCDVVKASMVACDEPNFAADLKPSSKTPGADGWCSYQTTMPKNDRKQCMLIESTLQAGQTALVDGATLLPAPPPAQTVLQPLTGERAQRYQLAARRIRDMTPFGRTQPRIAPPVRAE